MFQAEILVVRKGFWNWKDVHRNYCQDRELNPNSCFAIHFRNASHGSVDIDNCHPHVVRPDEWALIHNGMMPLEDQYPSQKSDSALFAEMLSDFSDDDLMKLEKNQRIKRLIGKYNSIVLFGQKNYLILNEDVGFWANGLWMSNINGGVI